MALFGIILALIVNLFIENSLLDTILSILGVIVFSGLTAYDTQNIKNTFYDYGDIIKKEMLGALNLYLDFVNIFLDLIKLLGKRRDD
jgi:FtsH-binding integral membrane protein